MTFRTSPFVALLAPLVAGLLSTAPLAVPLATGLIALPDAALARSTKAKASQKKSTLPKPYVSKALRAVLMPVTKEVARKFHLAKGSKGVMVVSVQPDGLGKLAGIKPGDVITSLLGYQVKKPSDVDTIIAWLLTQGTQDYKFGGLHKNGRSFATVALITYDYFWAPFDIYTVASWTSFTYGTYSYGQYMSYYSDDVYYSYERSDTYINETITSQTFITNVTTSTTEINYASYDEQIVEGRYVSGGDGEVWADAAPVAYSAADDPAEVEVADDAGAAGDAFTADPGDADYALAAEEEAAALGPDEAALYDDAPSADQPAEDATTEDQPADEGTTAEDQSLDDSASEDAPAEDQATDDAAAEDQPMDDSASEDAPADDQATDDAVAEDQPMDDSVSEDAPVENQAVDDAPTDDQPMDDSAAADDAPEDQAAEDAAVEDQPMDDASAEDQAVEDPSFEDSAAASEDAGDGGQSYDEGATSDDGGSAQCPEGTWLGSDGTCTSGDSGGSESYDGGADAGGSDGGGDEY